MRTSHTLLAAGLALALVSGAGIVTGNTLTAAATETSQQAVAESGRALTAARAEVLAREIEAAANAAAALYRAPLDLSDLRSAVDVAEARVESGEATSADRDLILELIDMAEQAQRALVAIDKETAAARTAIADATDLNLEHQLGAAMPAWGESAPTPQAVLTFDLAALQAAHKATRAAIDAELARRTEHARQLAEEARRAEEKAQAPAKTTTTTKAPVKATAGKVTKIAIKYVTQYDGSQPIIDRCKGPVEGRFPDIDFTIIVQHVGCGGAPWLSLKVGSKVQITGGKSAGVYVVRSTADFRKGGNVTDAFNARPDGSNLVLQTCYQSSNKMRFMYLVRA